MALPILSLLVVIEYGVDIEGLALVPESGDQWPAAASALTDGIDIVVAATPAEVPAGAVRPLMAHAAGADASSSPRPWPAGTSSCRALAARGWGLGHGRIRAQETVVQALRWAAQNAHAQAATTLPPPSVTARVGPLPEQIPGLPIYDPDRVDRGLPRPVQRLTAAATSTPSLHGSPAGEPSTVLPCQSTADTTRDSFVAFADWRSPA